MRRALVVASAVAALTIMPAAHSANGVCSVIETTNCVGAVGAEDGFGAGARQSEAGRKTGGRIDGRSNSGVVGRGATLLATFVETRYLPTCNGNAIGGADALCTVAVEACQTAGELRLWAYRREVVRATGATTPWVRVQDPPFVCLAPDNPALAPQIDPRIAIAAMIEREFKRVVVLKGTAQPSPQPETLVNIPTRFTTDAPASYDIPLTLLGQQVTITATARRWTWHFGDGISASTTAPGTAGRVEHVYRSSTELGAHVVIEWSGTYRIGAGPTLPITGTATTVGDPTPLAVRQARTDLVDQSA